MKIYWLGTAPNPNASVFDFYAGQRGWRLHAVRSDSDNIKDLKNAKAICGLVPSYGWLKEVPFKEKCVRCVRLAAQTVSNDTK